MRKINARRVITALAVGAAVAATTTACGTSDTSTSEGLTLKVAYYDAALQSFPAYLANELGMFNKHDLTVELLNVQGGPAATSALLSKSADIMLNGADNVTLARAAKNGPDLVAVSGNTSGQVNSLIVRPNLDTPNAGKGFPALMHDLKGKKIGVPARGSSLENITRMMLSQAGMDPDKDVNWVAVGTASAMTTSIQTQKVDVLLAPEPLLTQIVDVQKSAKVLLEMRDGQPESMQWPFNMWWALRDTTKSNAESIRAFQAAMKETYAYLGDEKNAAAVLPHLEKFMGVDTAVGQMMMSPINMSTFGYEIPQTGLERLWTNMLELGLVAEAPDYDVIVDAGARDTSN